MDIDDIYLAGKNAAYDSAAKKLLVSRKILGNADSIEGRLYQCFPSCFQALISKNQKKSLQSIIPLCYNTESAGMARLF